MNWNSLPENTGDPNFENVLAALQLRTPDRPTLFEFYLNERIYNRVVPGSDPMDDEAKYRRIMKAFHRLGYDYITVLIPGFQFTNPELREKKASISLDEGGVINDRKTLDAFEWPNPDYADYNLLDRLSHDLPDGMKFIPYSPDGILENVIRLMGFSELCYKLSDDPGLVEDVFERVGSLLVKYYTSVVKFDCVGACLANDDWGFKTSTLLSPADLRRLVFPWYRKIVDIAHAAGKPVILHSCGYFEEIMDDITDDMEFDGRHSFEDMILPVEDAYERYHHRIAILGGIDVDFVCHSSPGEIYKRSRAMLDRASSRGGFALGTGNSVPEYIPDENYFALIRAALDMR
jgi:uroporphyrinogen decarboxylase